MPNTEASESPTRKTAPMDITIFGILMILSGIGDIYIIVSNPQYSLPFFGMKPEGIISLLTKSVHPPIHFAAGYGAIYGRKWAYPLFMTYSVYGLINAMANRLLLPPPHRIRTIFIVGTVLVMAYLYCRRRQFKN